MKNRNARHSIWAILVFILSIALPAAGQQATPAAKPAAQPAAKPSTPPASVKTEPEAGPGTPDKVVIKVADRKVTQSQIDFLIENLNPQAKQSLESVGRRPLGEEYVRLLLLANAAEAEHLQDSPEIRDRIELQRTQMLAQVEYDKMAKEITVTPEEVGKYYTEHKPDFESAEVREFVVRKKPEGAKEGTPGFPEAEAKAKAEAMRKALVPGADIKQVTKDFGITNVVMIDAEPRTVRRKQLLPELDKAAFELKDGEVSEPLETSQAIVFLQIAGHHTSELKEVEKDIESRVRQQKLEEEMGDLRKKSDVWLDEKYFETPLTDTTPAPAQAPAAPSAPKQ